MFSLRNLRSGNGNFTLCPASRASRYCIKRERSSSRARRSRGTGRLLMKAVAKEAARSGCGMIKWWVAKWNKRGIEFYKRLGAKADSDWHEFQLSEKALRDLAASG
ncbi:MAG: hypothetical protein DME98_10185 [Verrucomicrobia bacterium]|nr:MAG: hypothetical protein DME98_10185 [Verrucomicrobiota bacterium]PYJ34911.1 MAG: hypothetical protein DME88_03540 [Verrucomicrobiota bacterium]